MKRFKKSGIFFFIIAICVFISACQLPVFPEAESDNTPSAAKTAQASDAPTEPPQEAPPALPSETAAEAAPYQTAADFDAQAYQYLTYIDTVLSDRDCIFGVDYEQTQNWLINELSRSGYSTDDIRVDDFTFFNPDADDASAQIAAKNISAFKDGTSDRQIIIGAHYDGTGSCDNGSGVALALAAADAFFGTQTYYDLTFVFFSGEEYGMYGSYAYVEAMGNDELARTQYMVNMDSLISGDYCYIYGGAADFENRTVSDTEAFENALNAAGALGLDIRTNPWTFDNPEPTAYDGVPAYPAPSTGDWSDHVAFRDAGIPYVYFEATNWDIGEYDGDEESVEFGPVIHTEKDNLTDIEEMFPDRTLNHLTTFSVLLRTLLEQDALEF